MTDFLFVLAGLSLLAWIYLGMGRYGFWRADQRLEKSPDFDGPWPRVTALVPARNEADVIADSLTALAGQDYPGAFSIIVVDDSSDDGTGEAAAAVARRFSGRVPIDVHRAPPPDPGWTGKLWALSHGLAAIDDKAAPDYILFTDADIVHPPGLLSRLAAKAVREERDLVSLMARLPNRHFWEKFLIPPFIFFFQLLYPFPAINRGKGRHAGAAGGCMLIDRSTLKAAGGLAALKDAIIDDCTLARNIRRAGGRLWLGLADESRSLRRYRHLSDIRELVARGAFAQLRHSGFLLLLALAGLTVAFVVPPLLVVTAPLHQSPAVIGFAALSWLIMAAVFWPTLADYRQHGAWALTLPLATVYYLAMTVESARRHWRGTGQRWKGRHYRPD